MDPASFEGDLKEKGLKLFPSSVYFPSIGFEGDLKEKGLKRPRTSIPDVLFVLKET